MRKFGLISLLALLALALTAGAIFAQDSSDTQATAWLGIAIADNDGQVVVTRVQSGSPADTADLQVGDVIVSFNEAAVSAAADLSDMVKAAAPGDAATLEIERNGDSMTIDATLGSAPANLRGGAFGRGQLGTALEPLTLAETLFNVDLEDADGGYTVVDTLTSRNPFALEVGDLITAVNGEDITTLSLETLATAIMSSDDHTLSLTVTRDGDEVTLEGDLLGGMFGMDRGFGPGQDFGQGNGRGQRGDRPFGQGGNDGSQRNPGQGNGGPGSAAPGNPGQGNGAPDNAAPATPEASTDGDGQA